MQICWRLILGLALGLNIGAFVAAQVIFDARADLGFSSADAGTMAGAILHRVNLATAIALLALIALDSAMRRSLLQPATAFWVMIALVVMLLLTLAEVIAITPSIAGMRERIARDYGAMDAAPQDLRARFGMLHGVSMLRGVVVIAIGVAAFVMDGVAGRARQASAS